MSINARALRFALKAYVYREPAVQELLAAARHEVAVLSEIGGHDAVVKQLRKAINAVVAVQVMT
jgi:hypothetical protein